MVAGRKCISRSTPGTETPDDVKPSSQFLPLISPGFFFFTHSPHLLPQQLSFSHSPCSFPPGTVCSVCAGWKACSCSCSYMQIIDLVGRLCFILVIFKLSLLLCLHYTSQRSLCNVSGDVRPASFQFTLMKGCTLLL